MGEIFISLFLGGLVLITVAFVFYDGGQTKGFRDGYRKAMKDIREESNDI